MWALSKSWYRTDELFLQPQNIQCNLSTLDSYVNTCCFDYLILLITWATNTNNNKKLASVELYSVEYCEVWYTQVLILSCFLLNLYICKLCDFIQLFYIILIISRILLNIYICKLYDIIQLFYIILILLRILLNIYICKLCDFIQLYNHCIIFIKKCNIFPHWLGLAELFVIISHSFYA